MNNPRKAPRICGSKTQSPPKLRVVIYRAPEPRLSFLASDEGRQAFDFFLHQTRYRFPADFSDPVLRSTNNDEALARTVVACGALQQIYEHDDDPFLLSPLGQFAMREYGRALTNVRIRLASDGRDLTLVCCLLFACFECMRGCPRAAVVHIKSGLDILLRCGEELMWNIVSRETMVYLFMRLDNQLVGLLGTSLSRTLRRDGDRGSSISARINLASSRNDAERSLDGVLNSIFHDRLDMALTMQNRPGSALPLDPGQTSRYLNEWHARFDTGLTRIWYLIAKMYVAIPPGSPENVWDQFQEEFETVISLAENYLLRTRQFSQKRTFSFNLGIVSPLYIVGVRCREMRIRRRAIWLLESCERREVLWDSTLSAMTARRVMEFEESLNTGLELFGRKVRNVTAVLDDDNGVRVEFE
ncbi:hypothetical protein BDV38DRAFT_296860 [Aspergillus pseudotamarii]|uniref:Fungal-specific transcription factor domain-containing protein n=1 Tax=Aspergillus pseudotamarii TaxID=132259 RepID=A0A5N6T4V9_ASPPS|nr:uncharacterized protein BDV38DRAFT_296860 [Aspergillus pseudotamarii]KAE8141346.1 hypothetical protein BDV38DRAFT_296860 [Aspergillus pseudotamarii]